MSADRSTRSRTARPADTPTFTLVVTSRGDPGALRALLAGLLPLCAAHSVQTVVVRAGPVDEALALADEFPPVRFLLPPGEATPAALRAAGMAAAEGDVVLFGTDDDPALRERLIHLLRSHGVPAPGADDTSDEPPRPIAEPPRGPADGAIPVSRQDPSSRDALEANECHLRVPHPSTAWTGSRRETGSSSSVQAQAG